MLEWKIIKEPIASAGYNIMWYRVCRYRRKIFNPRVSGYLRKILPQLRRIKREVIGRMKSQSLATLRKKFDWLKTVYWNENIVSSVGEDEETTMKYIKY